MRAVWYERTGPAAEVLSFGEMPTPVAGPGEVRVRLEASGVNPSDAGRRGGFYRALEYPRVMSVTVRVEKLEVGPGAVGVEIIREPGSARPRSMADRAPRRKYPKVLPKYCNPLVPSETWSGRGKRPRWLVAALETGHRLDEFEIDNVEKEAGKKRAAHDT